MNQLHSFLDIGVPNIAFLKNYALLDMSEFICTSTTVPPESYDCLPLTSKKKPMQDIQPLTTARNYCNRPFVSPQGGVAKQRMDIMSSTASSTKENGEQPQPMKPHESISHSTGFRSGHHTEELKNNLNIKFKRSESHLPNILTIFYYLFALN